MNARWDVLQVRIAITGVPGVGKTTVAKALAEKLGYQYINLNQLLIEKFKPQYNDFYDSYEIEDYMLEEISKELPENCVVDSHLSHLLPNVDVIVLLKLDPNQLKERLEKRGYDFRKIFENVWAQNLGVIESELPKDKKVIVIDTTGKSVEKIVNEILSSLKL